MCLSKGVVLTNRVGGCLAIRWLARAKRVIDLQWLNRFHPILLQAR
jgi:hypothetical protein